MGEFSSGEFSSGEFTVREFDEEEFSAGEFSEHPIKSRYSFSYDGNTYIKPTSKIRVPEYK